MNSVCPQIFGLSLVKLAVALCLIGGVARRTPDGTRTRGEVHCLLAGDPGTGKSQFLRYVQGLLLCSRVFAHPQGSSFPTKVRWETTHLPKPRRRTLAWLTVCACDRGRDGTKVE